MSASKIFCLSVFALSGCASLGETSEQSWHRLSSESPVSAWAVCMNEQSHKWLDVEEGSVDRSRLDIAENEVATDMRLFVEVMSDCRGLVKGEGWESLSYREKKEIFSRAFEQFKRIELNAIAAAQEPVT